MNRLNLSLAAALLGSALSAAPAFSQDGEGTAVSSEIKPGRMLYVTKSEPFAPIYSVAEDGSAQVLFEGHRITIPASTISETGGKLVTSLSKREIRDTASNPTH